MIDEVAAFAAEELIGSAGRKAKRRRPGCWWLWLMLLIPVAVLLLVLVLDS